jgi:hypothetical protein
MSCARALLVVCVLLPVFAAPAPALSDAAPDLRRQAGLVPHTPSQAFLDGSFIADEMHPAFLFGPVRDFVAGRPCPTAWLIEDAEQARLAGRSADNPVFEYTLTLEEACPQGVTWYVFLDQSAMRPEQWIEWRRQFHKRKAEGEYAETVQRLGKALEDGLPVSGELRFVSRDGVLEPRSPQEILLRMGVPPIYDCDKGARVGQ